MKQPEVPWALILILLVGVSSAAWLIMVEGWSFEGAYGLIAIIAGGVALSMFGLLYWLLPSGDWYQAKKVMWRVARDDLRALITALKGTDKK